MTRNNEGRTQIPPEIFEQFMKQQEEKFTSQQPQIPQQPQNNNTGYHVPTDFVTLPSKGMFYSQGHPWCNKEMVEVRYMTTREEDIITSPGLIQKGVVYDKLVESVCVDRIVANKILPGDKAAILINCRKNAYGDEYKFDNECTVCGTPYTKKVNLSELKNKEINYEAYNMTNEKTFVVQTPISKATVEFKLYDSQDEDFITKQVESRRRHNLPDDIVVNTHRRLIVSVNGDSTHPTINGFISSLLLKDSRFLQKAYVSVKPDVNLSYTHDCVMCGHENEGGVPFGANFFWSDV